MTAVEFGVGPLSEIEHSKQLRRAVVASTIGSAIDAYDFLLYVQMAPLVFARLYFPESDPVVGSIVYSDSVPLVADFDDVALRT